MEPQQIIEVLLNKEHMKMLSHQQHQEHQQHKQEHQHQKQHQFIKLLFPKLNNNYMLLLIQQIKLKNLKEHKE